MILWWESANIYTLSMILTPILIYIYRQRKYCNQLLCKIISLLTFLKVNTLQFLISHLLVIVLSTLTHRRILCPSTRTNTSSPISTLRILRNLLKALTINILCVLISILQRLLGP